MNPRPAAGISVQEIPTRQFVVPVPTQSQAIGWFCGIARQAPWDLFAPDRFRRPPCKGCLPAVCRINWAARRLASVTDIRIGASLEAIGSVGATVQFFGGAPHRFRLETGTFNENVGGLIVDFELSPPMTPASAMPLLVSSAMRSISSSRACSLASSVVNVSPG